MLPSTLKRCLFVLSAHSCFTPTWEKCRGGAELQQRGEPLADHYCGEFSLRSCSVGSRLCGPLCQCSACSGLISLRRAARPPQSSSVAVSGAGAPIPFQDWGQSHLQSPCLLQTGRGPGGSFWHFWAQWLVDLHLKHPSCWFTVLQVDG